MTFVEQSLASAILPHIVATGHATDGTVASARGPAFSGQNAAACRAAAGDAARGSIPFNWTIDLGPSAGRVGSAGAALWSVGAIVSIALVVTLLPLCGGQGAARGGVVHGGCFQDPSGGVAFAPMPLWLVQWLPATAKGAS